MERERARAARLGMGEDWRIAGGRRWGRKEEGAEERCLGYPLCLQGGWDCVCG